MNGFCQSSILPVVGYVYLGEFDGVQWFELVYGKSVKPGIRPIYDTYNEASRQYERAIDALNPVVTYTTTTSHSSDAWAGGVV